MTTAVFYQKFSTPLEHYGLRSPYECMERLLKEAMLRIADKIFCRTHKVNWYQNGVNITIDIKVNENVVTIQYRPSEKGCKVIITGNPTLVYAILAIVRDNLSELGSYTIVTDAASSIEFKTFCDPYYSVANCDLNISQDFDPTTGEGWIKLENIEFENTDRVVDFFSEIAGSMLMGNIEITTMEI